MMRIGLIGCGFISQKHINTLVRFENIHLQAVSDICQEKMEATISHYQEKKSEPQSISAYQNYEHLLLDPRINVVIIATISGLHAEIAKQALRHNKHVIVEKPLALSLENARDIVNLAKKHNRHVLVCHQLRYRPLLQKLKQLIQDGVLGTPYLGVVSLRLNRGVEYYTTAAWKGTWLQDGGMLINQGIHLVDLITWIFGDMRTIYGDITKNIDNKETEDIALGMITFKNNARGLIEANTVTKPKNIGYSLSIFAEKGSICIGGPSLNSVEHCYVENCPKLINELNQLTNYDDEHYRMYQDFSNAILKDKKPIMSATEGSRALEAIFALYQSHQNKSPVHLPLIDFSTCHMLDEIDF